MVIVDERRGSPAELHGLDPFAGGDVSDPIVRRCTVTSAAIVLGSRQGPDLVDADRVAAAGLDVVRRRSGGGSVLLRPRDVVWIDLVVPSGVAGGDVRSSMIRAGERWREALVALGATPDMLRMHTDGMVATPWSELVCFAGIGPGEIMVGDHKLLGLSQRRTRHGARIQCQVHRRSLLAEMPSLFAVATPTTAIGSAATLDDIGLGGVDDRDLAEALATSMRTTPV